MERAYELDFESAARSYDEQPVNRRANFSPLFSSARSPAGMATHQQLGDADFGSMLTLVSGSCSAKELLMASAPSPLALETLVATSCNLSINSNQSIALSTSSALTLRDGDRVDFWGDGQFAPFDLHLSPVQQQAQQHLHNHCQSLYSPMTKPQAMAHPSMINCMEPLGGTDFRTLPPAIDDGNGEEAYQSDVASALSSLLEDDDRLACRQSIARVATTMGVAFADRTEALPGGISVTVKPPPQQSRPWEQCATNPASAGSSTMAPIKDECSLLSPTTAEKKVLVTDNDVHLLSSADPCATSKFHNRSSSNYPNTTTWKEPFPFHAQLLFPGTPGAGGAATTPAPSTAAMTPALFGMHNGAMSPFRQYTSNATDRRPGCSQQLLSFQSARQHSAQGSLSSPAAHYGMRQQVAPPSTAQAEQWRRQLMLKRCNAAAQYSSVSSPFNGVAFATATSTSPAASSVSSNSRTAGLVVSYQSPVNKRARVPHSPPRFVGYGDQSAVGSRHRLVPPAPIPLQNGVDGVRSSPFTTPAVSRTLPATQWQGLTRPSFVLTPFTPAPNVHPPPQPFAQSQPRQIGIYSPQERRERIKRFLVKRKQRVFHKRIKYDCRKRLASACPRIKGRFVRRDEYLAAVERGQRVTHPHGGEAIAG